jgi:hypothetical protein
LTQFTSLQCGTWCWVPTVLVNSLTCRTNSASVSRRHYSCLSQSVRPDADSFSF